MKRTICILLLASALVPDPAWAGCRNESFPAFFARFSNDGHFQDERTQRPLALTTEQFGDSSRKTRVSIASKDMFWALKRPLHEVLKENAGIKPHLSENRTTSASVTFAIEDADILFDFEFEQHDGCWHLAGIRDFER